jgi:hypothetical protein
LLCSNPGWGDVSPPKPVQSTVSNVPSVQWAPTRAQSGRIGTHEIDIRTHVSRYSEVPESQGVAPGNTTSATPFAWSESHEDMRKTRYLALSGAYNTGAKAKICSRVAMRFGLQRRSLCIKERDNRPEFSPLRTVATSTTTLGLSNLMIPN